MLEFQTFSKGFHYLNKIPCFDETIEYVVKGIRHIEIEDGRQPIHQVSSRTLSSVKYIFPSEHILAALNMGIANADLFRKR